MILVFASYESGEHLNIAMDSIQEAVQMIIEYCNCTETVCEGVEADKLEKFIQERMKIQDNVYIPLNDGTWFTITICKQKIYSIVYATDNPCESDVIASFFSLENAKKAMQEIKKSEEEIYVSEDSYVLLNDAEACYQIQSSYLGK